MKKKKHSIHLEGISTLTPAFPFSRASAFYSWVIGISFLFFSACLPQAYIPSSPAPSPQSFMGTWAIYTVSADKTLEFSHYEKYAANYDFTQWNTKFSASGRWWTNGKYLCAKFGSPMITVCGETEFTDHGTFYYLESGKPLRDILVCKRHAPTSEPASPPRPAAAAPSTTSTKWPTNDAKPSSSGYEEYVEKVPCTSCYASGYKTCTWCSGTGRLSRTVTKYESGRTVYVDEKYDCTMCSGQGKPRCTICDGRGHMEYKRQRPKSN